MQELHAYKKCEEITKREAKNFYYGIRLLPSEKRRALCALYALARRADDISDDENPRKTKLDLLNKLKTDISNLVQGNSPDELPEEMHETDPSAPSLWGVYHAAHRFDIPLKALLEIVEGCENDIDEVKYLTMDDTIRYCRLVAGSVGRLSLGVFGCKDTETASPMADDLGVALQITNILRDIAADSAMGRVYLPKEHIDRFGCNPDLSGPKESLENLILFESETALSYFEKGFGLMPHLDYRSRACTAAMANIYKGVLKKIRRNPAMVLNERVSLSKAKKAVVAIRSLSGL